MAKPIVKNIHAFDANYAHLVEFAWSGNQAYTNRMVIYDASSQTVVYDNTLPDGAYKLNHEIPAHLLDNNKQYAVQISVIDINGDESPFSDKSYFNTVETPEFYFDGLVDGQTVYSSSITLNLVYAQTGTESLVWTQFFLYDATRTEVAKTEVDYAHSLTHTFRTLDNKVTYYVRAIAETAHGMALDTGYVSFTPSYQDPSAYARIYAENDEDTGFVNYYSNIVIISPDEEDYDYEDGFIDLTVIDAAATISLYGVSSPTTSMEVYWTDIYNQTFTTKVPDYATGTTISRYKYIEEITINGRTVQDGEPSYFGDPHELTSVQDCTLRVNRVPIENVTESNMLCSLPMNGTDYLIIKNDGTRILTQEVGYHVFSESDTVVKIEQIGDSYVYYYDFGGLIGSAPGNMYCSCIPVNKWGQNIAMDTETGYVKITTNTIETEKQMQRFFRENRVVILYPLYKTKQIKLPQIEPMPSLINQKLLRYSQALVIPGKTATFAIRMKSCRRTANILKVYCGEELDFILSARVYEDETYRLKLTVYGDGPTYVQYSDQINIDVDDIVTVFIRRINGVYGLYVNVFDNTDSDYKNIWMGVPKPTNAEEKDLWIDLNQNLVYIAEADAVRFYQEEEPADAEENNIWIGGEL